MTCNDLTTMQGYQDSSPRNGCQAIYPGHAAFIVHPHVHTCMKHAHNSRIDLLIPSNIYEPISPPTHTFKDSNVLICACLSLNYSTHSLMYALIQLLAHSLAGIFIRLPQVYSDSFAHTHFTHPDALFIDTHKNTTEGIQLIRVHGQISVTCI